MFDAPDVVVQRAVGAVPYFDLPADGDQPVAGLVGERPLELSAVPERAAADGAHGPGLPGALPEALPPAAVPVTWVPARPPGAFVQRSPGPPGGAGAPGVPGLPEARPPATAPSPAVQRDVRELPPGSGGGSGGGSEAPWRPRSASATATATATATSPPAAPTAATMPMAFVQRAPESAGPAGPAPAAGSTPVVVPVEWTPAVQRAPDPPDPPDPPDGTRVPAQTAAPPSAAPAPGPAAAPAESTDELVRRLAGPLSRLLRAELRLDRERAGVRLDPRH
ncbi:hypothetical protein ACWCQL_32045 [Streptomyces sp. NPDC002073]